MHTLPVRIALLALLVTSGLAAAYFLTEIDRQAGDLAVAERETATGVERIADVVNGIGSAQHGYVVPGQPDQPLFERVTALVKQLYDDTAALRPGLRSPDAHRALQSITESTDSLIAADTRARENLRLGQELMAADVVFSDGRSTLDGMTARLHELRQAERSAVETERTALATQRWTVLGAVAAAWLVGLVALVFVRPARKEGDARIPDAAGGSPDGLVGAADSRHLDGLRSPSVDLKAAADLCTALSRITTTAALPALLGRAATLLDAPGIILWMGAGEELFAVTAHGYGPQIIAKLGPIARAADNATAAAWRTGEIATVPGDASGNGAIVAPMFGPDACIGALAIEVRNRLEEDPLAQAVASMIAAQLATAVSAWPAASTAPEPSEESAAVAADRARTVARQLAREFRSAGM